MLLKALFLGILKRSQREIKVKNPPSPNLSHQGRGDFP
jgi:hypothetical protein